MTTTTTTMVGSTSSTTIMDLPHELQQLIICELDLTRDLTALMKTTRHFRRMIAPIVWSHTNFSLDNLTRETWPTCMYVDDELRKDLPLISEDPEVVRHLNIGVGTFPGFCRVSGNYEQELKMVRKLQLSIPFYTKHSEQEEVALNCASEYDDYLGWFASQVGELCPNVEVLEIESDTLHTEQPSTKNYHPLLPRVLKQFPNATKHLKLSLSRELDGLFDDILPFDFRIIKLRYGYTQIIGETLCTAGDDDITAKVKFGKLPSNVERFEIDTEHRLVDLGELTPIFAGCKNVKMLSMDVNHEFKNLEWLPESVKDLNFCGLPNSCPPKDVCNVKRLAICLEEMKVFQKLRCPNLEFLHIHSFQPEEVAAQAFTDCLEFCPNVKRLKCSGASAKTIATLVESSNWQLEELSIEYDPIQSVYQYRRLAEACGDTLRHLWVCSHKGDIVNVMYAFTSTCGRLDKVYLTWEGWVWKIGHLLENDLISVVPKSELLGKYTFLDGHLYNQTFDLQLHRFNGWYTSDVKRVANGKQQMCNNSNNNNAALAAA